MKILNLKPIKYTSLLSFALMCHVGVSNASVVEWNILNAADVGVTKNSFDLNGQTISNVDVNISDSSNSHLFDGASTNYSTSYTITQKSGTAEDIITLLDTIKTGASTYETYQLVITTTSDIDKSTGNPTSTGVSDIQYSYENGKTININATTISLAEYSAMVNGQQCNNIPITTLQDQPINIPEPTSIALLASGILGFCVSRRKVNQA